MRRTWLFIFLLIVGFSLINKSVLSVYTSDGCTSEDDRQEGWNKLSFVNQNELQNNITKCIESNNPPDWCCVCMESNNPSICTYLLDAIQQIYATPIPTLPPIDCTWSGWSECSKPCGTGIQTRYHTVSAANGGEECSGLNVRYCNTQSCPIDCVWSYGECQKSGNGCAKTRIITVEPQYGGKPCGDVTIKCYSCSDEEAAKVNNQETEIILETGTLTLIPPTPTIPPPTITQIQAQNRKVDLFPKKQATPTLAQPTPFTSPTTPPTFFAPSPTILHSRENQPQQIAPTPLPTIRPESRIPSSLATSQTNTTGGIQYKLNTNILSNITIVPTTNNNTIRPTDIPFLSKEQRLLAGKLPLSTGGLTISLQQKSGSQFITQQDGLTVKRGNQLFTISSQQTPAPQEPQRNTKQQTLTNLPSPQLEINANNVIAKSHMGLSVDPLSGVLTVATPSGPQKVSIMPDEALGIILELKALSSGLSTPSILLVSENGQLIYRITGQKMEKFFGLLPIAIQKQILISADTGSIVKIELPLLSTILSLFTF